LHKLTKLPTSPITHYKSEGNNVPHCELAVASENGTRVAPADGTWVGSENRTGAVQVHNFIM